MGNQLILASKSPRRRELLALCGVEFLSVEADVDETFDPAMDVVSACESIALKKASKVLSLHPHAVVLGSDTIVVVDNKILGKPANEEDAFRMLRLLSSRIHQVITSVAIISKAHQDVFTSIVDVKMVELSDQMILDYIRTGEPFDKAGAYGIQGKAAIFVEWISGDYYAVMGLPVVKVAQRLKNI